MCVCANMDTFLCHRSILTSHPIIPSVYRSVIVMQVTFIFSIDTRTLCIHPPPRMRMMAMTTRVTSNEQESHCWEERYWRLRNGYLAMVFIEEALYCYYNTMMTMASTVTTSTSVKEEELNGSCNLNKSSREETDKHIDIN